MAKNRIILLCFIICRFFITGDLYAIKRVWTRQFIGPWIEMASGICVDTNGNVYVTGYNYNGDNEDARIIKYDPSGALAWQRTYDGGLREHAFYSALDTFGNIYVSVTKGSTNNWGIFVMKYDPSGNIIWTNQYNSPIHDLGKGITVDPNDQDNVYLSGYMGMGPTFTNNTAILIKYNSTGDPIWTNYFSTATHDANIHDVAVDNSGNIIISGSMSSNYAGSKYIDIFILKYNPSGKPVWTNRINTSVLEVIHGVVVDDNDNIYATGYRHNGINKDIITIKYNSAGNIIWTRDFDGGFDDSANGLSIDSDNNIYIGGYVTRANKDYIILKYDSSGNLVFTEEYNSGIDDIVWGIDVDIYGYIYITGDMSTATAGDWLTIKYSQVSNPSNFKSTALSFSIIKWTWIDNSYFETNYAVYNSANSNISGLIGIDAAEWLQTGLSPNTPYTNYVTVFSKKTNLNSESIITYTLAHPPSSLKAFDKNEGILLTWQQGNGGNTRFAIKRAKDRNGAPSDWEFIVSWNDNLTATNYLDIGAQFDIGYWYMVYGYNGDGILTGPTEPAWTGRKDMVIENVIVGNNFISHGSGKEPVIFLKEPEDNTPIKIKIIDLNGVLVRDFGQINWLDVNGEIIWDLRNDANKPVDAGAYFVIADISGKKYIRRIYYAK